VNALKRDAQFSRTGAISLEVLSTTRATGACIVKA
jgi:hypothetical protein